jgi:hypothetical protein
MIEDELRIASESTKTIDTMEASRSSARRAPVG